MCFQVKLPNTERDCAMVTRFTAVQHFPGCSAVAAGNPPFPRRVEETFAARGLQT